MNIEEYIASGILEEYVLGQLSRKVAEEVENMAEKHPEIRAEIRSIEEGLEVYARSYSRKPSDSVRERLLERIGKEGPIPVSLVDNKGEKKSPASYLVAASISLAVLFGGSSLYFYNQWREALSQVSLLVLEKEQLASNLNTVKHKIKADDDYKSYLITFLKDTSTIEVQLKGLAISPASNAVVFWNKKSYEVFIDVKQLPAPSSQKQYQLWALKDGKPIDAGVIDLADKEGLKRMKDISGAQAFAVTLEKKGGSPTPNIEALYIMGKI